MLVSSAYITGLTPWFKPPGKVPACSAYGGGKAYTGFWWGNLRERDHLGDPGIGGRIILRWNFRSRMWGYGLDQAGSG
jgi:hypothetical protein